MTGSYASLDIQMSGFLQRNVKGFLKELALLF